MTFLTPSALVFAIAVPLLWLLYLLRRRRARVAVSNAFLWEAVALRAEARLAPARPPWTWLLALQTVILVLLAGALAQPTLGWLRATPRRIALVMDASASMNAREGARTRFDLARDRARDVVAGLRRGDLVQVIVAKRTPQVASDFSADHAAVRRLLDRLEPTDDAVDLNRAVALALAAASEDRRAEVVVFTDLAPARAAGAAALDAARYVQVGRASDNVGITRLDARRHVFSPHDGELFLEVANFGDLPRETGLRIRAGDRTIRDEHLTLVPGERRHVVQDLTGVGGLVTAELDAPDALEADNTAYALFNPPGRIAVLLVSDGNLFLEKALETSPLVTLTRMRVGEFQRARPARPFDIVICDRCGDADIDAPGLLRIHGAPVSRAEWRGALAVADREHPVLSLVNLEGVSVEGGVLLEPGDGDRVLVRAGQAPAFVASDRDGLRTLDLGFDVRASSLPTSVAFPVLVSNMVRWLSEAGGADRDHLQAGEPFRWTLPPSARVARATVTDPAKVTREVSVGEGVVRVVDTDRIGPYRLRVGDVERGFVANLLSADESDIRPGAVHASAPAVPAAATQPVRSADPEIWRSLVVVALVLLVIEWLAYARVVGAITARTRAARALRIAGAALLALGLLDLPLGRAAGRAAVAFAIDASDSMTPEARATAARALVDATARMAPGDEAGVVVFADNAVVERRLGEGRPRLPVSSAPPSSGTDIAAALRLARAMLQARGGGRIVLASDGRETAGDARAEAAATAAAGIPIDIVAPGEAQAEPREILIADVVAPRQVRLGEPFDIAVGVQAYAGARVSVRLERNGSAAGETTVSFGGPGLEAVRFSDRLDRAGLTRYRVTIAGADDRLADNNEGGAVVHASGKPHVLYLAESGGVPLPAAILRAGGFDVTVAPPSVLPDSPGALTAYAAVISDNVPAVRLSDAQMSALARYVEDAGGGFVMTGGAASFGPGGYVKTPIEDVMPVEMRVRARDRTPTLALVLVLDRSGSMADVEGGLTKIEIARQATLSVLDYLGPDDELGVIAFDAEPRATLDLGPVRDRHTIEAEIRTLDAGGGTIIFPAVDLARRWLGASRAERKHILLLSDGRSGPDDAKRLIESARRSEVTLSVAGIGRDRDERLLRDLADRSGGRAYFADRVRTLPGIFSRETMLASGKWIVDARVALHVARGHALLGGLDVSSLPGLSGYVASTPRSSADVILTSSLSDPILAATRAGLGRTAGLMSDLSSAWTADLVAWRDFGRLWTQMVRWVARPQSDALHATLRQRDRAVVVDLSAYEPDGRFLDFLDVRAILQTPDGRRSEIRLPQVGAGRYETVLDADARGAYLVSLAATSRDGRGPERSLLTGVYVSSLPEHRAVGTDLVLLDDLANTTGGVRLAPGDNPFNRSSPRRTPGLLWRDLVALSMASLLIEVAVRRGLVRLTWNRRTSRVKEPGRVRL